MAHGKPQNRRFSWQKNNVPCEKAIEGEKSCLPPEYSTANQGCKREIANNTIQEMAIKSLVPKNELSHKATIAECLLATPAMGQH